MEDDSAHEGFNQHELNDLSWDLGLSKKALELLALRLNEKNFIEKGVMISYFWSQKCEFLQYFLNDCSFVYRHNIEGLKKELSFLIFYSTEW